MRISDWSSDVCSSDLHRERLDAADVDRGLFKGFGRSARLFRQTEVEADRLSVWLMRGAGYDPQAAVRFWGRFGTRGGPVLIQPGTHPRWRDRVRSIEEEIAAIRAADAAGRPLEPPLIAAPPPLESGRRIPISASLPPRPQRMP